MPRRKVPEPPADPDRFEEAVRAHRRLDPVTDEEFERLTAYEQRHAFKVGGVAQARLVQEVHDAVDRAVADGTTLEDFKAEVGDKLAEAWGGDDPARLEMVFRTNTMRAYSDGRTEIFDDPVVREARPYKRYDAVGDSRTCDICDPLDGTVLPADDPFWRTHHPPNHPGCRCIHVALTPEEAGEEGVMDEPPEAAPPPAGFGTSEDYDPDYSSFSPEIAAILKERLGG